MNQIRQKTDDILVTALVLSVFFGASISFGFRLAGIVVTLFRVAIPLLLCVFFFRAYRDKSLDFRSMEKSLIVLLALWFIYSIFLMAYRGMIADKDAIRELLQMTLQFFIVLCILIAVKTEGMEEKVFLICKISIIALTVLGMFEIVSGVHLPTSGYYNASVIANSSNGIPRVATGIFFNENDYCACLALFSPLFFPEVGNKLHVNALRVLELSLMEFILLKDDAIICLFGIFVGLVIYSIVATVKYRWVIAGAVYAFVLEKLIMSFSLKRAAGKGLGSEVAEQFSGVSTQTGSAYVRMNTYITEFTHAISEGKGMGFGPYGVNKFLAPFNHSYVLNNPHSLWLELLANYGIVIFIFFVTICILSLGVLIACGEKNDRIRTVLIPMDIIFVIVGFASSNYIGIAYWWMLIALSVAYASKLLIGGAVKKTIKKRYIAATVVFLICLIGLAYALMTSGYIKYKFQEPLKPVFETKTEYKSSRITGKEVSRVEISLDGKRVKSFDVKGRKFAYDMELGKLKEGWHYYRYDYYNADGKESGHDGYLVNRFKDQTSILMPEEHIVNGRYFNRSVNVSAQDFYFDKKKAESRYSATGAYWLPDEMTDKNVDQRVNLDKEGIPKILVGENEFDYDVDLVTSYALMWYTQSLENKSAAKEKFISCTKWLAKHQKSDGSIPMLLGRRYREETINGGWVSAKVQGKALSVFSRAYEMTGDKLYLDAGNRALAYLQDKCLRTYDKDKDKPSDLLKYLSKDGPFSYFEDVSGNEAHYRLDTQLYVLIGLYDWAQIESKDGSGGAAIESFDNEIKMLKKTLPLYDLNGYLTGDLMHLSDQQIVALDADDKFVKSIVMLRAVSEISGDEKIKAFYDRYSSFMSDEFYRQNKELLNR